MRPRMRRLAVGLVALLAVSLSACATGRDARSGLILYNGKSGWNTTFQSMGAQAKEDVGIGFEPVAYADVQQYLAFVKASFRTSEKADIFTWHTGQELAELVANNEVEPSTDLWNDAIEKGWLTEDLKPFYTYGGEQYCVPFNVAYWVMFYNKNVFAEAGVSVPTTWDDLMEVATTLKDKGYTPFLEQANVFSFVWFETLLAGSDPDLYERLSTGEAKYTDPGVVEVMEVWKSMIEDGLMADPTTPDPAQEFKDGKLAMMPYGTWNNGELVDQQGLVPDEDFGIFAIPNLDPELKETSMVVESGPVCLPKDGVHNDQASKVLEWWVTPAAQKIWTSERKDLSANPEATVGDPLLDPLSGEAAEGKFRLVNRYYEATPSEVLLIALDAFSAFMVDPSDPMSTLETIQEVADKYWEEVQAGA